VDRLVAHGAGLVLLCLIVETRGGRGTAVIGGEGVALQAKQIDLGALEKPGIRGAVRSVAGDAAFDFDGFVFKDEGSGLIGMALKANSVFGRRRAQLPGEEAAVLIVAVSTLYEALIHAMMEGAVELLLLIEMAAVAQGRLAGLEQELALLCVVRIMAVRTAHAILEMYGARIVTVLGSVLMATQAPRADFLCGRSFESEYLGLVAAAVDVGLSGTVARFAHVPLRSFFLVHGGDKVRRALVVLDEILGRHVFVAGLASFLAHIARRIRRPFIRFGFAWRLSLLAGLLRLPGDNQDKSHQNWNEYGDRDENVAMKRSNHSNSRSFQRETGRPYCTAVSTR
jgi:hypothetical protein